MNSIHERSGMNGKRLKIMFIRVLMQYCLTAACVLLAATAFGAETGRMAGTVVDQATGEGIPGASVYLVGTNQGAVCDLDGTYLIKNVAPGQWTLRVQAVGFTAVTVTEVEVAADGIATVNFTMTSEVLNTGVEIKVTARKIQNTEAVMLKNRQEAPSVTDAISSEQIAKSGSSDAAQAMTKVVGATVMDNIAYVRGLGGRYTNTKLNGSTLPNPDPNKQSAQLDMVSTGLLDNIVVSKSFTPDKPGDFAGGSVDMTTKDYPERRTLKLSTSASYNTESTGESILTHAYGSKAWLAQNDGFHNIPDLITDNPVLWDSAQSIRGSVRVYDTLLADTGIVKYKVAAQESFRQELNASERKAPWGQSYSLNYGDQLFLFDRPLGIVQTFNYSRKISSQEVFNGEYNMSNDTGYGYDPQKEMSGRKSSDEIFWGTLSSLTLGIHRNHKLGFNYTHSRNGDLRTSYLFGPYPEYASGEDTEVRDIALTYLERKLSSTQLSGHHSLLGNRIRANWKSAWSDSYQNEPDQRFFVDQWRYINGDTVYAIEPSQFREPQRSFRELAVDTRNFSADIAVPLGRATKFKMGGAYSDEERSNSYTSFTYGSFEGYNVNMDGDIDLFARSVGLDRSEYNERRGYTRYYFENYIEQTMNERDQWVGSCRVNAYYGMFETAVPYLPALDMVFGARWEKTDMHSRSQSASYGYGRIQDEDWLPAVSFIYALTPEMNVRIGYSRTLARPTLREITPSASQDNSTAAFFLGNPDLVQTKIKNADLRWEWFRRPGEVLAVSAFYKYFDYPIEMAIVGANADIMPQNAEWGKLWGLEVEFRSRLDQVRSWLTNFTAGGNVTLISSRMAISDEEMKDIHQAWPDALAYRPMYGQSPYVVNFDVAYERPLSGTSLSLFYNVFGRRFRYNSTGTLADIYEMPRKQLDLFFSQRLFGGPSFKFSLKNILNDEVEYRYIDEIPLDEALRRGEKTAELYKPGMSVSIGISYDVW